MKSTAFAMAAVAASLFAAPVQAQGNTNINAVTQDSLISLGQATGFTTRQAGDGSVPAVQLETPEGVGFFAFGSVCEEGTCRGMRLQGRYRPEGQVTVGQINTINRQIPPAKVWYNEDLMFVERYLILDGGVSQANLSYELQSFPAFLAAAANAVSAPQGTQAQ